ncbi:MAG: cysW [Candidatus Eremiobacteraeota bacterium]|nr:cysW [Candidatus Eremiobacteraeota bacterium]
MKAHPPNRAGIVAIAIVAAILAVFIVLPLLSVAIEALAAGTHALGDVYREPSVVSAIGLSVAVTLVAVSVNAAFGLLAGWTIAKYRFPGKALLVTVIDAPLTVSPVIAGLAVLSTLGTRTPAGAWLAEHGVRIAFAPAGIALATMLVTFPYVARAVIAQMALQGREYEEAAIGLGASAWGTFWRVTFPASRASFLNGLLLCNARAIGEFGAVSVVSGSVRGVTETVPLHIADYYNEANGPAAFGLAAGLALVAIVLALAARAVARRDALPKGRPA